MQGRKACKYRLDTNFAKIDRIVHPQIEAFKKRVQAQPIHGMFVGEWAKLLSGEKDDEIRTALEKNLKISSVAAKEAAPGPALAKDVARRK